MSLGGLLVGMGLVTLSDLNEALERQRVEGGRHVFHHLPGGQELGDHGGQAEEKHAAARAGQPAPHGSTRLSTRGHLAGSIPMVESKWQT